MQISDVSTANHLHVYCCFLWCVQLWWAGTRPDPEFIDEEVNVFLAVFKICPERNFKTYKSVNTDILILLVGKKPVCMCGCASMSVYYDVFSMDIARLVCVGVAFIQYALRYMLAGFVWSFWLRHFNFTSCLDLWPEAVCWKPRS